jgi:small subunit ribosomal protein S17
VIEEEDKTEEQQEEAQEAEEAPEETPAEEPAAEEAAAEEAPADEPAAEAPAEEPAAEEPAAEEPEAGSTEGSAEVSDSGTPGSGAEDVPDGDSDSDWKTRYRLERSRRPAEARPQRTPEERQAERVQRRAADAAQRARHRQSQRKRKGEPRTGTPVAEPHPNPVKVRQGIVISDAADKTITVRIDIARRHPTYEKVVRRSRTLSAHDESNEAGQGDVVRIIETRPISKSKRWRLVEVVEKAK